MRSKSEEQTFPMSDFSDTLTIHIVEILIVTMHTTGLDEGRRQLFTYVEGRIR